MPRDIEVLQLVHLWNGFLSVTLAEMFLPGFERRCDCLRALLLAYGDDNDTAGRPRHSLRRARNSFADFRQMVRDLSHALPAALGYTMNVLW